MFLNNLTIINSQGGAKHMRTETYHVYLDSQERQILIHSLNQLRNQQIEQGRYTDPIDELLYKTLTAPTKKLKIKYS